ncbi:MAG TPA: phosphate transport system regulatory protein PhoU [Parvularcula sp.]|nr:phosphate transport system regulatory protein PhoU [Parvularcula sp.]
MTMASIVTTSPGAGLRALLGEFAQMAALVETQLSEAISALERRDVALAERVVRSDLKVDACHRRVDERALAILRAGALTDRQFREAASLLKLSADLERVGDLAKNVAKRTIAVALEAPAPSAVAGVVRMGRASLRQLSDILNALQSGNLDAAQAVWRGDNDLDELYNSLYGEVVAAMSGARGAVNPGVHLLFIVKNFERIGDHATNIAEAIHFVETGAHFAEERPKGDDPGAPPKPDRS